MKVRYMSDLHLEMYKGDQTFRPPEMPEDSETVLVLAGDIHVGENAMLFLWDMCDRFKYVIYVFGNHEFYGSSIPCLRAWYSEQRKRGNLDDNLFILDNDSVVLDGVKFIGSTLWTDMGHDTLSMALANTHMTDFNIIFTGADKKKLFSPQDSVFEHTNSVAYLDKELGVEHDGEVVVVTHHLPHYSSIAPRWRGNGFNNAFFSDLDWLFEKYSPEYWIHGHTHDSVSEPVWDTLVLCNPKGYGMENRQNFNPEAIFEI